jgi:hypothetical protein
MTHFTVGILIPPSELPQAEAYIARQMAPYNENVTVPSYVCFDLERAAADLARQVRDLEKIIASRDPIFKETTPEARYREFVTFHETFDADGRPTSTRNPQSRWDWYVVGGRWSGWLHDRETTTQSLTDNSAPVPDVVANGKFTYALITPDGQWHERGKMGWWGIATGEKPDADWHQEQCQLLERFIDHHLVLIDAHI